MYPENMGEKHTITYGTESCMTFRGIHDINDSMGAAANENYTIENDKRIR